LSSNRGAPVTIHIVAGPTAGGKSAFALSLAKKLNGVVINCDSMQIYDGLPVLTAQPDENDKREASHRLYGILQPAEACSSGIWQALAIREIETAIANNQTPIICGGNGLYIKTLMEGLSPIPETPPEIRERANARQEEIGTASLHEELKKRDPESAARFHPEHTARIVRAWEVFEATGKKLSDWQKESKNAPPENWHFEIHKIMPEREELYRRCDMRFNQMLDKGALEEVEDFAARIDSGEIPPNPLLTKALGFAHLRAFLSGKINKEQAITLAQTETRQYAKRQMTWFRNQL
jgi:tRNA dimethylallyltransferase